jgi:rubrerythrin
MDTHSADAVLQIAIQMEEVGQDFYEALASVSTDADQVRICRSLALAESHHRHLFRQLRSELSAQGRTVLVADADLAEARRVLKEVVVPDRDRMLQALSAGGSAELVDCAAQMERNSITYYQSLAEHLSDKRVVLTILEEELRHLRTLERLGSRLRSEPGSTS